MVCEQIAGVAHTVRRKCLDDVDKLVEQNMRADSNRWTHTVSKLKRSWCFLYKVAVYWKS